MESLVNPMGLVICEYLLSEECNMAVVLSFVCSLFVNLNRIQFVKNSDGAK